MADFISSRNEAHDDGGSPCMLEPSAIIAFFRMTDQTYDFILRSNFLGGLIIGE
jgi:hypothetical protein